MPQPGDYTGTTPRFGLPFLFPGQAQKEFFVNEAHALADVLLQSAIEGEASTPPAAPTDGTAWLVADNPVGEWSGKDGAIAGYQGGSWLFVAPIEGLRVWDKATGQELVFHDSWQRPQEPAAISGGAVIDAELRAAFADLVEALRISGIFPE